MRFPANIGPFHCITSLRDFSSSNCFSWVIQKIEPLRMFSAMSSLSEDSTKRILPAIHGVWEPPISRLQIRVPLRSSIAASFPPKLIVMIMPRSSIGMALMSDRPSTPPLKRLMLVRLSDQATEPFSTRRAVISPEEKTGTTILLFAPGLAAPSRPVVSPMPVYSQRDAPSLALNATRRLSIVLMKTRPSMMVGAALDGAGRCLRQRIVPLSGETESISSEPLVTYRALWRMKFRQ